MATDEIIIKEENEDKGLSVLSMILIAVLVISLGLNVYLFFKNRNAKKDILEAKTKNEQLIEKITALTNKNKDLSSSLNDKEVSLDEAYESIDAKETLIVRLQEENRTLQTIKNQVAKFDQVAKKIDASSAELRQVQKEINNTISSKQRLNQRILQEQMKSNN